MGKRLTLAISAAALLLSVPLSAQTSLPLEDGKDWTHSPSGLRIPAAVGGYQRIGASDFGKTQSDVSFSYRDASSRTFVTLYAYRAGIPDVSIWADRAEGSIMMRADEVYGKLDQAGRRWSRFSPWGNSKDGGLRLVYPVSGKSASATGLLVVQYGEWLLKIRMTSDRLDAAQVDAQLTKFFEGLKFAAPKTGSNPAYAIQPCPSPLPTAKVKQFEADVSEALLPALLQPLNEIKPSSRSETFCRQNAPNGGFSIYRPGASVNSYVIALGDGGVTVKVQPWPVTTKGRDKPFTSVLLYTNDAIVGFPRFDATPGWEQAVETLNKSRPSFEVGRTPETIKEIKVFVPGK